MRVRPPNRVSVLLRLPAVLALFLVGACSSSIGLDEEEELGDAYAAQLAGEMRLIHDAAALAELNRFGRALARQADSTGRVYDFHLVDSPEVNAFAIPGGHIFVNRGLIDEAEELSEFAGVLAHEIAHVTERHGLEQVEKQESANLLVQLVYLVLGREPGVLEQVAIQGGGAAVFAKYGRDAEREADWRAVETLRAAGYDPEGMATFFEELIRRQERSPTSVEQWFASHPTSEERVQYTRALIAGAERAGDGRLIVDTPEYQRFRARVKALR